MAEADPRIAEAIAVEAQPAKPKRRWGRLALMLSVPLLLLIGAVAYWISLQGKVSTDNAYVQLDKVSVSAEVGGQIVAVMVKENQQVKAGDLLFRIDPEPFRLKLAQADAMIATAQASRIAAASDSDLSGAEIAAAREAVAFARSTQARQEALWQRGFTTKASWEAARHQTAQAEENLRLAQARSHEAAAKMASGAQVPGVYPQIAAARAQRSLIEFDLGRTEVRAPVSGTVSQADRLHLGQELISGLPALTIVADGTGYVEANFKETDLADMRVGQPAELRFDAYPGLVLRGHVASIGAGTGSEFSVLPAQNATGNWVKVTQRVPVRIALDEASPRRLIAGLSSRVTVFVDGRKR
jgi:membrane fusion protein, multidrug efflux system